MNWSYQVSPPLLMGHKTEKDSGKTGDGEVDGELIHCFNTLDPIPITPHGF